MMFQSVKQIMEILKIVKEVDLLFLVLYSIKTHFIFKGNFLRVKSNANGAVFTSTFTINNEIILPIAGRCKFSFQTFIHCANSACDPANDRITVKIQEDGDSTFKDIFTTGFDTGRIRDDKWIKDEIDFTTTTNRIKVFNSVMNNFK